MARQVFPIIKDFCSGARLVVTSLDSGPLEPSDTMKSMGWYTSAAAAISPPISEGLQVPSAGWDEWWVLDANDDVLTLPRFAPFVNRSTWSLSEANATDDDPQLADERRRFWNLVGLLRPIAYLSTGPRSLFVTNNAALIEAVRSLTISNPRPDQDGH